MRGRSSKVINNKLSSHSKNNEIYFCGGQERKKEIKEGKKEEGREKPKPFAGVGWSPGHAHLGLQDLGSQTRA